MSLARRLRLDDIVSSFPELGPTVPDGGYSWIVLIGVLLIQMTVPSVLVIYGVVLGYLAKIDPAFDLWNEKIVLTPILFVAFWSLADPWTRAIVDLASVPRLVGLIGVTLLTVGIIASGYLATGGVGAYLASLSAGAVMGIGASFVIVQSESTLRKHFRIKLPLALILKNISTSIGLIFVPILVHALLANVGLKMALLLITIVFLPTAIGTLLLRSPAPQRASPYRLLLSEEDNELSVRLSTDRNNPHERGQENPAYKDEVQTEDAQSLFREGNTIFSYQEPEDDVEVFARPISDSNNKWKNELQVFQPFRFWAAVVAWIGVKLCILFFWILLPTLYITRTLSVFPFDWLMLPIAAGIGTFVPSIASYWIFHSSSHKRRLFFGVTCWISSFVLIGLTYSDNYSWFMLCAFFGGIGTGSLLVCQDLALFDMFGAEFQRRAHKAFSTVVGLNILVFCFMYDSDLCLLLTALFLYLGGSYWIFSPIISLVKSRRRAEKTNTASIYNNSQTI